MRFCFVFLALYLFSFDSYSFMNIENLRRSSKKGLHGSSSLRVSGATGNTEKFLSDTSVSNFYNTGKSEWLLFLNHQYGEAFSERNVDKGKAHLRYTFVIRDKWSWENFTQGEFDGFQRLTSRFIYGQTLRYKAYQSDESTLYLGFGAFYEWERIKASGTDTFMKIENLRGNFYASYHLDIKDRDTFFTTVYFQPFKSDDYRFLLSSGYQIPLNEYFSLSLEINYKYDSRPPEDIIKSDFVYFTTLNYSY